MEAFILFLYFIPFVLAFFRDHNNSLAIFMFNLFFGWTGIGWLCAFIWACTGNVKKRA